MARGLSLKNEERRAWTKNRLDKVYNNFDKVYNKSRQGLQSIFFCKQELAVLCYR
jgi:hypothetical protein